MNTIHQRAGIGDDDRPEEVASSRTSPASGSGIHVVDEDRWQIAWDARGAGTWLRFRCAWAAARARTDGGVPGKSVLLAAHLGVHPTALSRTNFKLPAAALARAAEVFDVSSSFLIDGRLDPPPSWLGHHLLIAALVRRAAERLASEAVAAGRVEPLAEEILLTHDAERAIAALPEAQAHAAEVRRLWAIAAGMIAGRLGTITLHLDHATCGTVQQALHAALARRRPVDEDDPVVLALLAIRRAVAQAVRGPAS